MITIFNPTIIIMTYCTVILTYSARRHHIEPYAFFSQALKAHLLTKEERDRNCYKGHMKKNGCVSVCLHLGSKEHRFYKLIIVTNNSWNLSVL